MHNRSASIYRKVLHPLSSLPWPMSKLAWLGVESETEASPTPFILLPESSSPASMIPDVLK